MRRGPCRWRSRIILPVCRITRNRHPRSVGVNDDDEDAGGDDGDEYAWDDDENDWVDPSENGVLGKRKTTRPLNPAALNPPLSLAASGTSRL